VTLHWLQSVAGHNYMTIIIVCHTNAGIVCRNTF